MRRAGLTFVEVVISVLLVAVAGLFLLDLLHTGARASARGTEMQLATAVGARVMDRFLVAGYAGLAKLAGRTEELDLTRFGEPGEGTAGGLSVDGVLYQARFASEQVEPGLLRLQLTVHWKHPASREGEREGTITLMRYVVDPDAAPATP